MILKEAGVSKCRLSFYIAQAEDRDRHSLFARLKQGNYPEELNLSSKKESQ